jgi:phytoene dehydrogenase-like protein
MNGKTFDVVVIGAGANGLVASCRLAKAGRRVLLLDRSDTPGGTGSVVEFAPGFRAAPLSVDPGWVPPKLARGLGLSGLEPAAVDAPLTVWTGPGAYLTLSRDPSRAAAAIAAHSKNDAEKWGRFTAQLRSFASLLEALYQTPAPDVVLASLGDLLPLVGVGRKFRGLGKRDMIGFLRTLPMSVWELLDDWFSFGPLKAAVAAGGVQDIQQGPRSGGTGFVCCITSSVRRPGPYAAASPGKSDPGRSPRRPCAPRSNLA